LALLPAQLIHGKAHKTSFRSAKATDDELQSLAILTARAAIEVFEQLRRFPEIRDIFRPDDALAHHASAPYLDCRFHTAPSAAAE